MMLLHAIAGVCFREQSLQYKVFEFLGSPIIAMFIGVLYALLTLGYLRGQDTQKLRDALGRLKTNCRYHVDYCRWGCIRTST